MSSAADATLRATQVNVSVVGKNNQYQSMGRMILLAIRKSGQIQLIILRPDKKPLVGLPAIPNINWVIQNDVYVSMVGGNVRFLLQFANTQEAQLFTMFALSGRLAASPEPICIINKNGSPIAAEDRFTISYEAYDLSASQIQGPSMTEKDMTLSAGDQTPLSAIAKSGTLNSTFLVKMSENMISIVHSIGGAAKQSQAAEETEAAQENIQENDVSQSQEIPTRKDATLEQEEQQKEEPHHQLQLYQHHHRLRSQQQLQQHRNKLKQSHQLLQRQKRHQMFNSKYLSHNQHNHQNHSMMPNFNLFIMKWKQSSMNFLR